MRRRTAQTQRQPSVSAKRQQVRMRSLWRPIRPIHSPGGCTRPHNSASRWKDRVRSPVPAAASTPRRRRCCAAPCCSPLQTSFCERASQWSYLAVRLRAPVPSLTPGSWVIVASNAALHASLSSAFFSLRQAVISSALGMNALQSLSASGVHAMRCSSVPCEKEGAGKTVAKSKTSKMHHGAEQVSRSIIHLLFWLFALIREPAIRNRSQYSTSSWQIQIHSCQSPCLERNVGVWSFRPRYIPPASLRADMRGSPGSVCFAINIGCTQTTKPSHDYPSIGNNTNASISCCG